VSFQDGEKKVEKGILVRGPREERKDRERRQRQKLMAL